jgi:hypothetical protein
MLGIGPYFVTGYVVTNQYIQLPELYEASPQRLMVAGVLMAINAVLVRRWIEQTPEQGRAQRGALRPRRDAMAEFRPTAVRGQVRRPSLAGLKLLEVSPYAWRTSFGRLVWHAWRLGWGRMLGIVVAAGVFIAFLYLVVPGSSPSMVVVPLAVGTVILPALLGSVAFGGDQREGRYEFLAQHGASTGRVWLSRLLVWLAPMTLALIVLSVVVWPVIRDEVEAHYHWSYPLTAVLFAALAGFAFGQLSSLWVKSEIRAAGLAVVFMVLITAWSPIASSWRITPWWSLLPLALGALLATWVDMRAWMNNRRDLASWGKSIAAVLVPVAIVVGTVPLVRDWQIEQALRQVPAQHVAALHQQREELNSRAATDSRVATRYQALAAQLEEGEALSEEDLTELRQLTTEEVFRVGRLLHQPTASILARELRLRGHRAKTLDEAWENYLALYRFRGQMLQEGREGIQEIVNRVIDRELELAAFEFALRRGQTAERLEAAIDDLREADAAYPSTDRDVVREYIDMHDALDGRLEEAATLSLFHFLPGEERRARKALDVAAAIAMEEAERVYRYEPPPRYIENLADYLPPQRLAPFRAAHTSPAVRNWWPSMVSLVERVGAAKEEEARRGLE